MTRLTSFTEAAKIAEEAKDPVLDLLKRADERLNRPDPDVRGGMIAIHAARLAMAVKLSRKREDGWAWFGAAIGLGIGQIAYSHEPAWLTWVAVAWLVIVGRWQIWRSKSGLVK